MSVAEWFLPYERTFAAGSRMHVCSHTYCGCEDCRKDAEVRCRALIDRSDPVLTKPATLRDTVAEAMGGDDCG
jgi:hypothetical protein